MKTKLSRSVAMVLLAVGSVALAGTAPAQGWKPERNVELTVPSGPGGSNDIAAPRKLVNGWTKNSPRSRWS